MQAVEEKMAMLKARYDSSVKKKATIESEIGATKVKLERAEKLVGGLSSEYMRWTESVKELQQARSTLFGQWVEVIRRLKITVKTDGPTLMRTMGNYLLVGIAVLLENEGETFDPALTPILG